MYLHECRGSRRLEDESEPEELAVQAAVNRREGCRELGPLDQQMLSATDHLSSPLRNCLVDERSGCSLVGGHLPRTCNTLVLSPGEGVYWLLCVNLKQIRVIKGTSLT